MIHGSGHGTLAPDRERGPRATGQIGIEFLAIQEALSPRPVEERNRKHN